MATLAAEYGRRPKELSPEVMDVLEAQPWPGNVRELRNIIERLVIMTPGDRIEMRHLPASLLARRRPASRPRVCAGSRRRARRRGHPLPRRCSGRFREALHLEEVQEAGGT